MCGADREHKRTVPACPDKVECDGKGKNPPKVGSGESATGGPNNDDNDKNKRNWEKVKEKYLEEKLAEQGTSPHEIKYEYLGKGAKISLYNIYVDKVSGQLAIFMGKALVYITDYFIK